VHRALFEKQALGPASLRETAEHISDTERNSADAERDSKDVKLYAFLNAQLKSGKPKSYSGLVTDVRNFGFFVDVPDLAMSGLVSLSSLDDDFYVFQQDRGYLIGRRSRRIFRLGDKLLVQVAKVNQFKKQVDFRLVPGQLRRRAEDVSGSRPSQRFQPKKPEATRFDGHPRNRQKKANRGHFTRRRN
jgi:ribonuclease R